MESTRVPTRTIGGREIVSNPYGSTRPTPVVATASSPRGRNPVQLVPPLQREIKGEVENSTISQRQLLPPIVVEAPKYRIAAKATEVDELPSRNGSVFSSPTTLGGMRTEYPPVAHRIPDRILLETDVR